MVLVTIGIAKLCEDQQEMAVKGVLKKAISGYTTAYQHQPYATYKVKSSADEILSAYALPEEEGV